MNRRKDPREIEENEETKRGSNNPNERETGDNNKDKLSDFPDCILLHILSFLNVIQAIRTSLLSTRWKHLWKHLPTLTVSSSKFNTDKGFTKFVNRFLSLRDSSTALNTLEFECQEGLAEPRLLKRIVRYAVSHNVNRLRLDCRIHHIPFPSSLFSCRSLTSLDLGYQSIPVIFPNSLNFPVLTYLKLCNFSFCSGNDGRVEPFSTFNRLNTLILRSYILQDERQPLCISSTTLLVLSIHTGYDRQHYSNILLFAPSLCTFAFIGNPFHKLTGSHLSSIKQVTIDILCEFDYSVASSFCLLDWLMKITDIKSLTVTPRTLRALSLNPDILKLKLPFLCNLKSLQLNMCWDLYRFSASSWRDIKMELAGGKSWKKIVELQEAIKKWSNPRYSSIMDGMIDCLLSAKVDIVSLHP